MLCMRPTGIEWGDGEAARFEGFMVFDPDFFTVRPVDGAQERTPALRLAACVPSAETGRQGFELRSDTEIIQCRGASAAEDEAWMRRIGEQVRAVQQQVEAKRWAYLRLNVYHVTEGGFVRAFNAVSETVLAGGIFHTGLEVHGQEFSFGARSPEAGSGLSGLFQCQPRSCKKMRFYKTLPLGACKLSKPDASKILKRFQAEWRAGDYDFVRNNCVTFCRALKDALADDSCNSDIPEWVDSLARTTSRLCLSHSPPSPAHMAQGLDSSATKRDERQHLHAQMPSVWLRANENC